MKKRLCCLLCAAALVAGLGAMPAMAGQTTAVRVKDTFAEGELDIADWYLSDGRGVETAGEEAMWSVSDGRDGTGIVTKVPVGNAEGIVLEVDVSYFETGRAPNGASVEGQLGILYNLETNEGNWAMGRDPGDTTSSDGFYLTYRRDVPHNGGKLNGFAIGGYKSTLWEVQNGASEHLVYPWAWAMGMVDGLEDVPGSGILRKSTLRVEVGSDGSFVLSKRPVGAAVSSAAVLAKSGASYKLRAPEADTYAGVILTDGSYGGPKRADILDVRVEDAGGALADFGESEQDLLEDYYLRTGNNTGSVKVGKKYSLIFTENYAEGNPLVLRNEILSSGKGGVATDAAEVLASLDLAELGEGRTFGFGFGFDQRSTAQIGNANSSYFYFKRRDSLLYFGLKSFKETGEIEIIAPTAMQSGSFYGTVGLRLDGGGGVSVLLNGSEVAEAEGKDVFPFGYFAIGGTGSGALEVMFRSLEVKNSYYSRPENSEITETFDNNVFNKNEWKIYDSRYWKDESGGISVRDNLLHFDNVGNNAGLETVYSYSNFELTFDLVDVRREPVYADDGTLIYPASCWVGFTYGLTIPTGNFDDAYRACPLFYFEAPLDAGGRVNGATRLMIGNAGFPGNMAPMPPKYDFWNKKNAGKVLNVRAVLVDSRMKIEVKYSEETVWTKLADFTADRPLDGHITLWGMGDTTRPPSPNTPYCGNYKLDNVGVKNLDENPNSIEVSFSPNVAAGVPDYEYTPEDGADYLPAIGKKDSLLWLWIALPAALAAAGGVTAYCLVKRRKSE